MNVCKNPDLVNFGQESRRGAKHRSVYRDTRKLKTSFNHNFSHLGIGIQEPEAPNDNALKQNLSCSKTKMTKT